MSKNRKIVIIIKEVTDKGMGQIEAGTVHNTRNSKRNTSQVKLRGTNEQIRVGLSLVRSMRIESGSREPTIKLTKQRNNTNKGKRERG